VPFASLQVRVCSPQLPQLCSVGPEQLWPLQVGSHSQFGPHVCVPLRLAPQRRVVPGMQEPWLAQADHSDHSALSVSQLRDCVPQLPQACVGGPLQA
jgi:hypothetical protein